MRLEGIIPLFDDVTREINAQMPGNGFLYASAIFGYIWQNRDDHELFNRPTTEIAEAVGVSDKTIKKYLAFLIEHDWITEISESGHGKSAVYEISKSRNFRFTISARIGSYGNFRNSEIGRLEPCSNLVRNHVPISGTHEHDNDDELENIPILWSSIGLGPEFLNSMVRHYQNDAGALLDILLAWAEWVGDHPYHSLKPQLIYHNIKTGQYPPDDDPSRAAVDPDLLDAAQRSRALREDLIVLEREASGYANDWTDAIRSAA